MKLAETIRRLRLDKNVTQEVLAEVLGVSMQAVSKWENNVACPDIALLPVISSYFGVSIDYLLTGRSDGNQQLPDIPRNGKFKLSSDIPRDGKLKVIQMLDGKLLSVEDVDKKQKIEIILPDNLNHNQEVNIEIYGDCTIEGNVSGNVMSKEKVMCGNVSGHVEAEGDAYCGNVGEYVKAAGDVNCGNIGKYLETHGDVNCGDVLEYVKTDGTVTVTK